LTYFAFSNCFVVTRKVSDHPARHGFCPAHLLCLHIQMPTTWGKSNLLCPCAFSSQQNADDTARKRPTTSKLALGEGDRTRTPDTLWAPPNRNCSVCTNYVFDCTGCESTWHTLPGHVRACTIQCPQGRGCTGCLGSRSQGFFALELGRWNEHEQWQTL